MRKTSFACYRLHMPSDFYTAEVIQHTDLNTYVYTVRVHTSHGVIRSSRITSTTTFPPALFDARLHPRAIEARPFESVHAALLRTSLALVA
ncbi:hypothetical protein SEA_IAMGROOT_52 [Microbacterium phage IAmGroot]|uniref:Uncharacterized protein n=1 Tax=Microbacterium phage IAmGroot TaxID=2588486 RepID=A0A4Y6E733_9CAUD|nr:hypothetical protein SEA_IAMGROOT_52 [Microbacterium phage IAmGroot]